MPWIENIINVLQSILFELIFSFLIFIVLYLAYKVEVKNYSFNLHLRILNRLKNRIEKKSYENRINIYVDKYHDFIKRPGFLAIIVPLLIVGIIGFILYNQMLFFAVIGSGSMEPTFKKSDLILMQNIDLEIHDGDIIMFKTPTVLIPVTHRVVSISDGGISTKGDARRFRDDWVVKYDQIEGKAITINEKPILIKNVGAYFIEDFEGGIVTQRYNEELILMRKIISSIKSLGLVIFFIAIFMYIISSIK